MQKAAVALTIIATLLFLALAGSQLVNFSAANFFPDPGPDLPRIYIRSNGNIEPATALIERAGNIYKLTGNIVLYTIEIQRDNIVLDGAGYTILGNSSRFKYDDGNNGVIVAGHNNINITRLSFEEGDTGVRISESSNINIVGNTFGNGINTGVSLQDSTHILIEDNDFDHSSLSCNGSGNTIRNNMLTGSVHIEGSLNLISDNKIESATPITMDLADSNIIARNKITGPVPSPQMLDRNFTGNEGIALFRNCSNNLIFANNITGFNNQAIRTVFSCSNNTFHGNYISNNGFAIALQDGAVNNTFYGNYITNSCIIVGHAESVWDNGTAGNYWGDYNGTDSNGDGIGDTPYMITGIKWDNEIRGPVSFISGQDNYPLMNPPLMKLYDFEHGSVVVSQTEPVLVVSTAVVIAFLVAASLLVYIKKSKSKTNHTGVLAPQKGADKHE
jgi:parallel beta-helix repeat protein